MRALRREAEKGQLSRGGREQRQVRQREQLAPVPPALQKKPEDTNRRSADMWSFAVLLWELVTREVPFADLSNMEIGMKVSPQLETLELGDWWW